MTYNVVPFETLAASSALQSSDEMLIRQTRNTVAAYGRATPQGITNYVGPNLPYIPCARPLAYNFATDPNYTGLTVFPTISTDSQTVSMILGGHGAVAAPQYAAVSSGLTTGGDFTVGGLINRDRIVAFQLSHTPLIDTTTTATAADFYKFILQIRDLNNPANKLAISIASTGNAPGNGSIVIQFPDGTKTIKTDIGAGIASAYELTLYVNLETGGVGIVLNGVDLGYQADPAISSNAVYVLAPSNYVMMVLGEDSTVSTQSYVTKTVTASLVTSYSLMGNLPEFATDLNGTWGYVPKDNPAFPIRPIDLTPINLPLTISPNANVINPLLGTTGSANAFAASTSSSMTIGSGTISSQFVVIGDTSLFTAAANFLSQNFMIIQASTSNALLAYVFEAPAAGQPTVVQNSGAYMIDPAYKAGTPVVVSVDPTTGIVTCVTNNGSFVLPLTTSSGASVPMTQPSGAATVFAMGVGSILNTNDTATHTLTTTINEALTGSTVYGLTPPAGSTPMTGALGSPVIGVSGAITWAAPSSSTTTSFAETANVAGVKASLIPIAGTITATPHWIAFSFDTSAYNMAPAVAEGTSVLNISQNPLPDSAYWFGYNSALANTNPGSSNSDPASTLVSGTSGAATTNSVTFFFTNKAPSALATAYGTSEFVVAPDGLAITFNQSGTTIAGRILTSGIAGSFTINIDQLFLFHLGVTGIVFVIDPVANVLDIILSGTTESQLTGYGTQVGVVAGTTQAVLSVPLNSAGLQANQPFYVTATGYSTNGSQHTVDIQTTTSYGITIPGGVLPLGFSQPNALPNDIKIGNRFLVTKPGPLATPNNTNTGSVIVQVDQGAVIEVLQLPTTNGLAASIIDYTSDGYINNLIQSSFNTVTAANVSNPFPTDGLYIIDTPLAYEILGGGPTATMTAYGAATVPTGTTSLIYGDLTMYAAPGSLVRVQGGLPTVLLANAAYDQASVGGSFPNLDQNNTYEVYTDSVASWNRNLIPAMVNSGSSSQPLSNFSNVGMFEFTLDEALPASFNATAPVSLSIGVYLPELPTSATAMTVVPTSQITNASAPPAGSCFVYLDLPSLTLRMLTSALGTPTVIGQVGLPAGINAFGPGDVFTFFIDANLATPVLLVFYNGINITLGTGIALLPANTNPSFIRAVGYAPFIYRNITYRYTPVAINTGRSMYSFCYNRSYKVGTVNLPLFGAVAPVPLFPAVTTGGAGGSTVQPPVTIALATSGQSIPVDVSNSSFVTITNALAGASSLTVAVTSGSPLVFNSAFVSVQNGSTSGDLTITLTGVVDPLGHGTVLVIPPGASALYELNNAATPQMRRLDIQQKQAPVAAWNGTTTFNVALSQDYSVYPIDLSLASITTGVVVALPAFTATGWPVGEFTLVLNQGATPVTGLTFTGAHFPEGQPVIETNAEAITVLRFVTDIHGNVICTYISAIQRDTPIQVILAKTDVSLPTDSFLMINTAPTGALASFAVGTIVQKKSVVETAGAAAVVSYDSLPLYNGMRIVVVSTSTDGATTAVQNDAFGNAGLVLTRNPGANAAANPQLNGAFAAYAALGWSTEASYDPAFWDPMIPIGSLSLAPVTGPASFGSPLTGLVPGGGGLSYNPPTSSTLTSYTTTFTTAGTYDVVGMPLSGTVAAGSTTWIGIQPVTTSLGASGFGGNIVAMIADQSIFTADSFSTASYVELAFGLTANGLMAMPYANGTAGTAVTVDAAYVPGTPVIISINAATGALTIVTNNGTFTPAVSVPVTANIMVGILSLLVSTDGATHTLTIDISSTLTSGKVYGLTPPAGAVPYVGLALATVPTPITLNKRYIVSTGGQFTRPSGAVVTIPSGALVEVIGTVAAPDLAVTFFYQQSDINALAHIQALDVLPVFENSVISYVAPDGLYTSAMVAALSLNSSFSTSLAPYDLVYVKSGKVYVLSGSTSLQDSYAPYNDSYGDLGTGGYSIDMVPGTTWDPVNTPAILTGNSGYMEVTYQGLTSVANAAAMTTLVSGITITAAVLGLMTPIKPQANQAVDVTLANITDYNAAPVAAVSEFFYYIDFINNELVVNHNPNSVATGSTSTTAVPANGGLYPLNPGDVFGINANNTSGTYTITFTKNGLSLGSVVADTFISNVPVALAPFAVTKLANGGAGGLWLMNSGQNRFVYWDKSTPTVPVINFLKAKENNAASLATRTIVLTAPGSVTLDTRFFLDALITVAGATTITISGSKEHIRHLFLTSAVNSVVTITGTYQNQTVVVPAGGQIVVTLTLAGSGVKQYTVSSVETITGVLTTVNLPLVSGNYNQTSAAIAGISVYEVDLSNGNGSLIFGNLTGTTNTPIRLIIKQNSTGNGTLSFPVQDSQLKNIGYVLGTPVVPLTAGAVMVLDFTVDSAGFLWCSSDSTKFNAASSSSTAPAFVYPIPSVVGYGTNPATSGKVGDTSVMIFAKSVIQSVSFNFSVNSTVDVTKPIKLALKYTNDVAGSNVFMIQLGYQVFSTASVVGSVSYTNNTDTMGVPTTTGALNDYSTTTAIIPANAAAVGDLITCVFSRQSTNAADTNTGNLQLFDIVLFQ